MKPRILLLTLVLVSWGLTSCNDNEDKIWGNSKNAHRIVQAVALDGDTEVCQEDFTYEGDLLTSIIHKHEEVQGEGNWLPVSKSEVTYEGNEVFISRSYMTDGEWEEWARYRLVVQQGIVVEEASSELIDGIWVEDEKYTYKYSGSALTSWKGYDLNDEDVMEYTWKGYFFYSSGLLIKATEYHTDDFGDMSLESVTDVSYTSGKVSSYRTSYSDVVEMVNAYKSDYAYDELGKVSSRDQYFWDEDASSWSDLASRTEFTYNEDGDLASEGYTWYYEDGGSESDMWQFEYEAGNGNAWFIKGYAGSVETVYPSIKSAAFGANSSSVYVPYYKQLLQCLK